MLDANLRGKISFIFDAGAVFFRKIKWKPNGVTILAFAVGVFASVLYLLSMPIAAVIVLWVSGYLDAVDGALARLTGTSSALGTFLDVIFDRVVEAFILLSLGIVHPGAAFPLLCAALSVVLSISNFLLTGTLVHIKTQKSFFYQSGLMERSEGFIIFSLMWLFPSHLKTLAYICAALIGFTAVQRFVMSVILLKKQEKGENQHESKNTPA
jgi:CDP-diacylglycerol--glycerol-3-phosphate 3-phosphatidyltransferase